MTKMTTAECVTPMHPDKICDRISDAILDACLEQDPMSRVAIETMGGHRGIIVKGEMTTKAFVNIEEVVKRIVGDNYNILVDITTQSPEIARGVDAEGAGDQGIMVGYACRDNEAMIPHAHYLARSLCQYIYKMFPHDGKTQITLDENKRIKTIVASFQNAKSSLLECCIQDWLKSVNLFVRPTIHCNPAGDWLIGGFDADTGMTGRKVIVDNYGPQIPIGGGAFSGKDATKVDRSAAYKARQLALRYLAKNTSASECLVKLAYAIGIARPVMATVELHEHGQWTNADINYEDNDELLPAEIIKDLDLRKPQFEETSKWGHFGNNFLWDKYDL